MSLLSFQHLPEFSNGKNHSVFALDRSGNFELFDEFVDDDQVCQLVMKWQNIQTRNPVQNKKLNRLIQAAINHDIAKDRPLPAPVKLESEKGGTVYVDVVPLPPVLRNKLNGVQMLLSFRVVERSRASVQNVLQAEYHLTPTEASVAALLTEGMSLKQLARELDFSIWTARSHLRAIFQKTETHRQAELVSLLVHLAD